jgi:hypothetical protein
VAGCESPRHRRAHRRARSAQADSLDSLRFS